MRPGSVRLRATSVATSAMIAVGDVQFDFFPLPALRAQDLVLANPAWARGRPFMTAKDAVARLALLPLLAGEVRIKSVALDHVTLDLETGREAPGLGAAGSGLEIEAHMLQRDRLDPHFAREQPHEHRVRLSKELARLGIGNRGSLAR